MRALRWWMRAVGAFYLILAVGTIPAISMPTRSRIGQYPGLAELTDTIAFELLVETWFMFGLELAVIGAMLWVASRQPLRHVILAWTVIGLELIRGVVDDLWLLATGHPAASLIVFLVLHVIIIGAGVWAIGRARSEAPAAARV